MASLLFQFECFYPFPKFSTENIEGQQYLCAIQSLTCEMANRTSWRSLARTCCCTSHSSTTKLKTQNSSNVLATEQRRLQSFIHAVQELPEFV